MPKQWAEQHLPIFGVFPDEGAGSHPPVALDRRVCVVGRLYGANLPLDHPQTSRYHALVVRDNGHVYLRDLASTNGVQRNGEPVLEVELADDDVLRVGAFTLRCASGFNGRLNGADHAGDANGDGDLDVADDEAAATASATASAAAPPGELLLGSTTLPLPPGQHTFLIGRRTHCDLRLSGEEVAPVHAVLFEMDGKRYIRDLNTPCGTFVNGDPVHQAELRSGDAVRVGTTTLEYRASAPPLVATRTREPADVGSIDIPLSGDDSLPLPIAAAGESHLGIPVARDVQMQPLDSREGSSLVGDLVESYAHDAPAARREREATEAAEAVAPQDESPPGHPAPFTPHPKETNPAAPVEVAELPGAAASARPADQAEVPELPGRDLPGAGTGEASRIELIPAAGVPVPEDQLPPPDPAGGKDKYVMPITDLPQTVLPGADAGRLPEGHVGLHELEGRDERGDSADETLAGEAVISELVDQLADQATTLKSAWKEHREHRPPRDDAAAESAPPVKPDEPE